MRTSENIEQEQTRRHHWPLEKAPNTRQKHDRSWSSGFPTCSWGKRWRCNRSCCWRDWCWRVHQKRWHTTRTDHRTDWRPWYRRWAKTRDRRAVRGRWQESLGLRHSRLPINRHISHFVSSVSKAMLTRNIDTALLSVRHSVRLSRSSIVSKRLHISSYFLQHVLAPSF